MASRAAALNLCAWTVSGLVISPLASTFTGTPFFVHRPCEWSVSSVTESPFSKRASRSCRFTGCVEVRNGSKGIDFFMCGPRSLRMRMWIGIWPPSKFERDFEPEREPAPFCPRPDVLPVPEPSPRPTRLRLLRLPGAGLSVCRPKSSFSFSVIDPHQVAHAVQHAARLRAVLDLDRVADAAEPERAQRVELLLVRAVLAPDLRHLHDAGASSAASVVPFAGAAAAGAPSSVSVAARSPPRPRTWLIDSPRSSATSSGVRSDWSPCTVALTRLIGFC